MSAENWESLSEPVAWRPTEEYLRRAASTLHGRHAIADYATLLERADGDPAWFWDAVSRTSSSSGSGPIPRCWTPPAASRGLPGSSAANSTTSPPPLTSMPPVPTRQQTALSSGRARTASPPTHLRRALALTNQIANALRALGVNRGDRVAIYMPMIPETRRRHSGLRQARRDLHARLLRLWRRGRRYPPPGQRGQRPHHRGRLLSPRQGGSHEGNRRRRRGPISPSVEHVLVVRRVGKASLDRWARRLVARSRPDAAGQLSTLATDAEDPYMLIYTSGTTGKPKGAVHVHCGFPIKGAQDMAHLFDVQAGRHPLLAHRHWLDDGSLGHQRYVDARCHPGPLRGHPRLPRRRTGSGTLPSGTASPSWASRLPSSAH